MNNEKFNGGEKYSKMFRRKLKRKRKFSNVRFGIKSHFPTSKIETTEIDEQFIFQLTT